MSRPLEILFEDADYIALNKPAGVPVHGGAAVQTQTVVERLASTAHPVHRLDADTSGVLLLARTAAAASRASSEWSAAEKTYLALVVGPVREMTLRADLDDSHGRPRSALTRVEPRAASEDGAYTLARIRLGTGRTHQIRRHLADAGHPILMDDRYGDFAANKRFRAQAREAGAPTPKRTLLHHHVLRWAGREVVAPLPERWSAWLCAAGIRAEV